MRLFLSLLLLFLTTPAWATTWYVRDGGGTYYNAGSNPSGQCSGTANAIYPGSGINQACAVSNPMMILGAGCGNYGFGPCDRASVIASGDTVNIDGDSDNSPGNQAQYPIGYDSGGIITPSNSTNCSAAGSLNCTMKDVPSGSDSSHRTIIQGTGSHLAQLWGREKLNQVLEVDASHITVQNIEVTDHSACIGNGFPGGGTVDGFPASCQSSTPPFGSWAKEGMFYGGTDVVLTNIWVHGIAVNGVDSDNFTNVTETNVTISGNGMNGEGLGQIYSGGTLTFTGLVENNPITIYNGCGEHYPMHSSDPYDTANYHNCHDAGASGQGDGLGCQANVCNCGTVQLNGPGDISFNMQDGEDFLHCTGGSATFYDYRMRFEGNEGQQLKTNGANTYVENSQIIGDCYYFAGQSFTYNEGANSEVCRAGGEAINMVLNNGTYSIINSTVLATGPGIQDAGASSACSGTVNWYNDNVIGGYNTPVYGNNALATWIDKECTSGSYTLNEDYNHIWNVSGSGVQCGTSPGTHDKCSDTSAATTSTLTTSMIGPTAYYQGNDLGHLLYANSGGLLISNANNAVSLQGTSNDINTVARQSSTYTVGSYTLNSCVAGGAVCFESNECCSSASCTNNICGATSCTTNGCACTSGAGCNSGVCCNSICANSCGSAGTYYDQIAGKSLITGNSNF